MRVPNCEAAEVPLPKISEYLLNTAHPDAADKADFFLAHGFRTQQPQSLGEALLEYVRKHEVVNSRTIRFGVTYAVDGPISAPDGEQLHLRTVWMVESTSANPRLVTAYPIRPPPRSWGRIMQ